MLITILYPGYEEHSRNQVSYALHYFVKDWIEAGHDVEVVRMWPKYPALFKLTAKGKRNNRYNKDCSFHIEGVDISRVSINKFPKIDFLKLDINRSVEKILQNTNSNKKPDVIVCHLMNPSLYISKKLKDIWEIPLVFVAHRSDIYEFANMRRRLNRYLKITSHIDKIGFRNHNLMNKYKEMKLPEKDSFIIHSGIESELIIEEGKLKNKIKSESRVIFVAASMIPLKNIDIIIQAFEKVAIEYDLYLKIAGDGPEKNKLLSLANTTIVKDRIEFLGFITRDSVMEYMEEADIFVMVSSPETFGLVYLEAMAKGCITIGTKGEGIDGVIKEGINGFLCDPEDVKALAVKLKKVLDLEKQLKRELILNAVATASQMTQKSMSMKYLDALKRTILDFRN